MTEQPPEDSFRAWLSRWGRPAWFLVGIGIVVYFAYQILQPVSVVAISVTVALFLAAVLWSPVEWLTDIGVPRLISSFVVLVLALAAIGGTLFYVVPAIGSSFDNLSEDITAAGDRVRDWLKGDPLNLTDRQIDDTWDAITSQASTSENSDGETENALVGGARAGIEFLGGIFLVMIVAFFVLKDGRRLVDRLVTLVPEEKADDVRTAIRVGRKSLALYMRGIALVGVVDGVAIGVGLWLVGVPLVLPLSILVFFGAFFPVIGAFTSGLVAVAVAFVNGGLLDAAIVLAIVTAVQQLEGDVVLPLVFGKSLKLHPLVVLLGVAAGGLAFGLVGAFLVIPTIAVALAIHEQIADEPEESYLHLVRG